VFLGFECGAKAAKEGDVKSRSPAGRSANGHFHEDWAEWLASLACTVRITTLASRGGIDLRFIATIENPEQERPSVISERASRIPVSRALISISIATFISYLMLNPMYSREQA